MRYAFVTLNETLFSNTGHKLCCNYLYHVNKEIESIYLYVER